jgi:hypothetical protein
MAKWKRLNVGAVLKSKEGNGSYLSLNKDTFKDLAESIAKLGPEEKNLNLQLMNKKALLANLEDGIAKGYLTDEARIAQQRQRIESFPEWKLFDIVLLEKTGE